MSEEENHIKIEIYESSTGGEVRKMDFNKSMKEKLRYCINYVDKNTEMKNFVFLTKLKTITTH